MVRKIFLITFFSYLISSYVINAEETYLTPGKLIFSQGGYLESFPGTMTSGKSNSDGYLKIGNDKGIEFAGSILEISTEKTAPFVISKNFQTNLYSPSPTNVTTYLFSGSYLNKFVLMENKDSKFGFSAYTGSTSAGFLPSMLYIQNKKGEGNYNTVLKNMVYVLKFPTQIRVGIGTSTPRSTLEVSGDLKISGGGLSLPPDTIAASNEQQGNTGGTNSSIYLCPTSINIDSVTFNVIFFVTCKIKTIGGRPNFKIYLTGTLKAGTSITPVESPQVYPGWVGFNSNHPYTALLSTYYRDAATIGLSWSTRLEPGTYTAYVVVNGEAYSPNFEVKLSYIKMMSGTAGTFLPSDEQAALPEGSNPSLILTDNNLSGTFFTTNTLVLTPPGYTDEDDATSILQNTSQGLILRSKKGLRNLRVNKVKVYDKATKYDLLVVKTHPQSNSGSYSTPIVSGSSTGPVGFAAYPAYIKKQYDAFNSGATTLENPSLSEDVSANIQYTNGNFHFKNKVNISNAIIANSYGVHISNEPQEPTSTDPMLRIDGNIIVSGNLKAKMGFISSANLRTAQVYSPGITMLINELKLSIPSFGQNSQRVKVMVSAILPFKLHGGNYPTHFAVKITLYLNGIPIGSGYIGQSSHIQYKGFSRLYTLQINGTVDNLESGKEYPIKIECSSVTGTYSGGWGTFQSGTPTLYLLADEFNKANIVFIGTLL